jgi:3-hydroxyacyl-CoA dehydrogenase
MSQINVNAVTVLGAGTMGAQIALHFANVGIPSLARPYLRHGDRAWTRLAAQPDPSSHPTCRARGHRRPRHTWIGSIRRLGDRSGGRRWMSNSGCWQGSMSGGGPDHHHHQHVRHRLAPLPKAARRFPPLDRHALLQPPRYLRLLEIIPTPETDPAVVDAVSRFADRMLGKGVVVAKDTPNFIANHIGLYGVMRVFDALATGRYSIEEIDAITGPATGRPSSATFRTMDIAAWTCWRT